MSPRRGLGCPYEGHVAPQRVAQVAKRLLEALAVFCMFFFSGKMWDVKLEGFLIGRVGHCDEFIIIRQFGWNFMVFSLGKFPT